MPQKQSLLGRFLIWRVKHIKHKHFVMLLSIVVGLSVGLAAVVIKNAVHFIEKLLTYGFVKEYENYLYFIYPTVGILIAVLFIKLVIRQRVGHGIPTVLYSISKNNGVIKRHNMFSSIITSAFTVGFGGSVGLEGPTVATGAAIGSNIGRLFHLNYRQITLLLACACAGAMAAIFKAPIAAIVFALEVIMLDLTMASLIPLLMASVSAALTSYMFLGQNVIYNINIEESFNIYDTPFYVLLGVFAGLVSVYFTKMYMYIGSVFDKMQNGHTKLIVGGVILGVLIFFLPPLYGEGYSSVNACLHGDFSYLFNNTLYYDYKDSMLAVFVLFLIILIFKVIATAVTFGSGGVGGIFAPSLFLGANAGLFFAKGLKLLNIHVSDSNFALVGMAGVIAGVIHAPLTAIFLIAEITGGYELFVPLMITAVISYATVKIFVPNSVYTVQLAKRGELMTHDKDKNVLSLMKVNKLIERNFNTICPDATLGDLVEVISRSKRNIFPVIDENEMLHGIIFLDDIRHVMFKPDMYDNTYVRDVMYMPTPCVDPDESMEEVAEKFRKSEHFNLPVLKNGKYIGFVSRANVFSSYRRMLKHFSEE